MPKEAELKSMQFPPFMSLAFLHFSLFCGEKNPVVMAYSKSQQACSLYEKGRVVSFGQRASAHVFLRSRHKSKNPVEFLHFRKYFYDFKYNHFLFGVKPNITHMYLAFIYFFSSSFERNGLEKKDGAQTVKSLDLWLQILNE